MTKIIPKISTRGYYDLDSGKTIKKNNYYLYPKDLLKSLNCKEVCIVIHGLRNDKKSANAKFILVKNKLRKLNYRYPVVGFSYDSNTKGAHLKKHVRKSLHVGQLIAKKNGRNLSKFILNLKKLYPEIKIRLIGHSLGAQVILHTLESLEKSQCSFHILSGVYFFGASISSDVLSKKKFKKIFQNLVSEKTINYFAPTDDVLYAAKKYHLVRQPLGLDGYSGKHISKFYNKKVYPTNHRFASYTKMLSSFP